MRRTQKRIRCIKCDLYFKDRLASEDSKTEQKLCWNCRFVWRTVGLMLASFASLRNINREVAIDIDDLKIRKKRKLKIN